MLARKLKFLKKDFEQIKTKTVFKSNTVFGLLYFLESDFNKSTIVIPKKIYKKASERNKIKRIFYNNLKKIKEEQKNEAQNISCIFFIKTFQDIDFFKSEIYSIINEYYKNLK